jgi:hypothetical protein
MIREQIKTLSDQGLMLLLNDTVMRIGSHSTGEYVVEEYIAKQKDIISAIEEEIEKRASNEY